ncbi:MAG: aldolase/citrate lyase family protein, partial [Alphaproteobacteria bacterium]|nr:aldolase/citrate lyase family protein [Alphaproteobacteria bacterium]
MSHTRTPERTRRLQRSELAVPGSNPGMFEKAAASNVDYVFLDLEDAVAPDDKIAARSNIIQALNYIDWRGAGKTISIRINGLDTHYMYRDVVEIVEQAGEFLDTILIPKAGVPGDIYMVDAMVSQIETAVGLNHRIGLEALIETTLGMANVEAIATSSDRLEAMHFGVAMVLYSAIAVPSQFEVSDKLPVFFQPGEHNLGDVYDFQQHFVGNT